MRMMLLGFVLLTMMMNFRKQEVFLLSWSLSQSRQICCRQTRHIVMNGGSGHFIGCVTSHVLFKDLFPDKNEKRPKNLKIGYTPNPKVSLVTETSKSSLIFVMLILILFHGLETWDWLVSRSCTIKITDLHYTLWTPSPFLNYLFCSIKSNLLYSFLYLSLQSRRNVLNLHKQKENAKINKTWPQISSIISSL